jgi:hypothetical protein
MSKIIQKRRKKSQDQKAKNKKNLFAPTFKLKSQTIHFRPHLPLKEPANQSLSNVPDPYPTKSPRVNPKDQLANQPIQKT